MSIKVGQKALNFLMEDKTRKGWTLSKIESRFIVLYFYPKDNTPGCTIEAKEFSDKIKEFEKLGALVIGISGGDYMSKEIFCKKNNLSVLLLSDTDFVTSRAYGVYGDKRFVGRVFNGIMRTTFILDKDKNLLKIYNDVKALGHAQQVLDDLKAMAK